MYIKKFENFAEGINALTALSISVSDVLGQSGCLKPKLELSSEPAVRAWLAECSMHQLRGNRIGWDIEMYSSPYGVAYRTSGGMIFGWGFFPDPMTGDGQDEPVFFVDRPLGKPKPEGGSTLFSAFKAAGWAKSSSGDCNRLAQKVGWIQAANEEEAVQTDDLLLPRMM